MSTVLFIQYFCLRVGLLQLLFGYVDRNSVFRQCITMLGSMHLEDKLVIAAVGFAGHQILGSTEVSVGEGIFIRMFICMAVHIQIFKVFNKQFAEVFGENFISGFPWRVPARMFLGEIVQGSYSLCDIR